jgi:hypothetical protein
MEVRLASQAAPGRAANEDYGFALPGFVGVLDGVSVPAGLSTGCVHGPAWYVRRLATHLAHAYARNTDAALTDLLANAIELVNNDHGGQCDLSHPGTPASTVSLLRQTGERIDYLVLCDSPLVVDQGEKVTVLTDARFEAAVAEMRAEALTGQSAIGSADHAERLLQVAIKRQERTNQPDGYWISAANPQAAHEAIIGSLALRGDERVRRAALLTDGASCAVEDFELFDWRGLLDLLTTDGPDTLISRVRQAELSDRDGYARPRYKRHDDATAALCLFEREPQP